MLCNTGGVHASDNQGTSGAFGERAGTILHRSCILKSTQAKPVVLPQNRLLKFIGPFYE